MLYAGMPGNAENEAKAFEEQVWRGILLREVISFNIWLKKEHSGDKNIMECFAYLRDHRHNVEEDPI